MNRYSKGGGKNSKPPERQGEPAPGGNQEAESAVVWDGTESKLVGDEAGTFEEPHTGIQISYVLKEEEIYECLKETGCVRSNGRLYGAALAVLCILFVALAAAGFLLRNRTYFYWAAPIPVLIALAAVLPVRSNRRRAREGTDGRRISMQVYPDRIRVGGGSKQWDVPLDGSSECARVGDMIALFVESREKKNPCREKLIVLPLRCVDPSVLAEVQAMILAGTTPKSFSRR